MITYGNLIRKCIIGMELPSYPTDQLVMLVNVVSHLHNKHLWSVNLENKSLMCAGYWGCGPEHSTVESGYHWQAHVLIGIIFENYALDNELCLIARVRDRYHTSKWMTSYFVQLAPRAWLMASTADILPNELPTEHWRVKQSNKVLSRKSPTCSIHFWCHQR